MRSMRKRGRVWLASTAAAGSLFVLQGCDPNVRDTVLSGVSGAATSLASTFIQAFFEALANDAAEEAPATVKAIICDAPPIFGETPTDIG